MPIRVVWIKPCHLHTTRPVRSKKGPKGKPSRDPKHGICGVQHEINTRLLILVAQGICQKYDRTNHVSRIWLLRMPSKNDVDSGIWNRQDRDILQVNEASKQWGKQMSENNQLPDTRLRDIGTRGDWSCSLLLLFWSGSEYSRWASQTTNGKDGHQIPVLRTKINPEDIEVDLRFRIRTTGPLPSPLHSGFLTN